MIILSHRGYWKRHDEKNTVVAFDRSFSLDFGTETDLRDHNGEIVVSHDPPEQNPITLDMLFSVLSKHKKELPLALNIKADGLQNKLAMILQKYQIENYFVFDMSVPDMLGYIRKGINIYTRHSEFEKTPVLYEQSQGVWIDSFKSSWIDEAVIRSHLSNGKRICIVSSELHKRSFKSDWKKIKQMSIIESSDVMLCTDYPEQARKYFNE
mgnify:CR=1 FL=1|tara:strand:+ start:2179 stop:2808 length:630 start_codon:yes stop_codon:yes gene_type:complete